MSHSVRAVVSARPDQVAVEEISLAPLGADQVMIRTLHSGVSTGTDKWVLQGKFTWGNAQYPLCPGYQRVGVIEELGADVTAFRVGQVVATTTSVGLEGVHPFWGAHIERAASAQGSVYPADGVDPRAASLFVSAQVGYNAASRVTGAPGDGVIVVGDGIIGSSAALCARARGFRVLMVGRHDTRLAPLAELGIHTLNSRTGSLDAVASFDPVASIDTIHSLDSFATYFPALPIRSGQVVFSGHSPGGVTTWGDMEAMQKKELTAHFVSGWTPERLTATLQLMRSGDLPLERLVGSVARRTEAIVGLLTDVINGGLEPVAATIEWGDPS
ncbi:MAG TPA: medium chain dehydrogenase/reductase family protein [Rhodoglobus sp.]|nr:medium chain dehydrogenase/reductase family protein [Rhodoglobus sp.]